MPVCFLPLDNNKMQSEKAKFRYITPFVFSCNISHEMVTELLINLMMKYDDVNVFGCNKSKNEIWGKKISKTKNSFHIILSICKKGNTHSTITITPMVGEDAQIKKFLLKIIDVIKLYAGQSL